MAIHTRDHIDQAVIKQIFLNQDYDLTKIERHADIQARYEAIVAAGHTPLIIDGGANIGASCLYFALEFPQARIVGIEPEPDNFRLAQANCESIPNIDLVHAGLANASGRAKIQNPNADNWSFQTEVDTEGDLKLVAFNDLIAQAKQDNQVPFLVKIDIEGFEDNLFACNTEWVDEFYLLVIELHDWMLPGQASSGNFLKCVAALGRDFVYRGENVFSIKN